MPFVFLFKLFTLGHIHVDIELINEEDMGMARRSLMDPDDIRKITVSALVDTGALMMSINENIQEYLQLPIVETRRLELANGKMLECPIGAPLVVRFKDHTAHCSAVILPGNSEPLLGAIPLEETNVIIDPQRQELVPSPRFIRL
jgi:clan AA aspartic protease